MWFINAFMTRRAAEDQDGMPGGSGTARTNVLHRAYIVPTPKDATTSTYISNIGVLHRPM
jgi:hypothetical protein